MTTAIVVGVSTGALKPVLEKLATLMRDEFCKVKNVRKDVEFLRDELSSMEAALERLADMDELDQQTKNWRNEVRDMSYDIENIIDDFGRNFLEKNEKVGLVKKAVGFLKTFKGRYQIAGQIEGIKKLVLETSKRRKRYLIDIPPSNNVTVDPRVATLQQDAASLVGLKVPTDELVDWLNDKEMHLKVVSIVGYGGLGKTTLANEIYRQPEGGFDCRAFVSVTQKYNISKLIRSLLSELGSEACSHDCEENVLVNKLKEHLQKKRYLIVIDDVWEKLPWYIIKGAFPDNGLGSRVITTTRIHDVAKACCSNPRDYILKMKPLSDEDSRRLFFNRIFDSEEACPPQLRDVSTEILEKCDGMPLAIISISGMLASERNFDQEDWEHIRNSLGSGTNLTLEGIRKILDLSYKNLPPHLKTCLLYVGMYPEDFKIPRQHLELQWIAEGFIIRETGQDVEKVARSYFSELVNRSLIQAIEFDEHGLVKHCKVHDTIRDLILSKCAEENFLTVVDDPQAITKLDNKVRRLSLHRDDEINGTKSWGNISLSQVRTFMIFGDRDGIPPLSLFKFLRVLHIENPRSVGVDLTGLSNMHQLRYLAVYDRWGRIKLPTQITGLQHLETLDVCGNVNHPFDIVHLPCLMFLNVSLNVAQLPYGFGNMKSLRYVKKFDLMKNSLDNIESLRELASLRFLSVRGYNGYFSNAGHAADGMERRMDALCSSLGKNCISLECLGLYIKGCMDVLMDLSPPPRRLERLWMGDRIDDWTSAKGGCRSFFTVPGWIAKLGECCFFSRVPNWMGELNNLKELEINVVKPDVGILAELPALTFLRIYIIQGLRERFVIHAREFPVLKHLELRLSSGSYLAFQAGAMPKLQWLGLQFSCLRWNQYVPGPAGMQHLSALEDIFAVIRDSYEHAFAESVLKSAIQLHPNHPRLHINSTYSFGSEFKLVSFPPSDDSGGVAAPLNRPGR